MSARRDMEDALLSAGLPLMGKVTEELLDTLEDIAFTRAEEAFYKAQLMECECPDAEQCSSILDAHLKYERIEEAMDA